MLQTPILIFDLDDTLYDEMTYVLSGFSHVAKYLTESKGIPSKNSLQEMKEILDSQGRGHVFDTLLKNHQIYSKKLVNECLQVYRHHIPKLELYSDSKWLLKRYHDHLLFIVTDGHKIVQGIKVKALKLDITMEHCYLTNRYGNKYSKPSPHCFLLICKKYKVSPKDVVYIADNPYKDFVGLKPLGFQTVRILRGRYKDVRLDSLHEADRTITSLDEI
jgi:putative hydrolase of the HAD superfamily